ncbi:MAG: transposase [Rhizobiales bacterium]|nr:transposase [Hyphomicrobiales bacterium]
MTTHRIRTRNDAVDPGLVPPVLMVWLSIFRDCFTAPVWDHVLVLVAGAVLAPGKRTVSQVLRVMGLSAKPGFARYHAVLSRARWSARAVARRLLAQVLGAFLPTGEVVIGIDDTIERRWGCKIAARGIYRDPVRSSHSHFVKTSGLRWLSLMVMVPIPWARRRWALPFLTILAPSERWSSEHGRRHKKLTDWARQAIRQVKRWLPDRRLIIVADASFAALDLIAALRHQVCLVTRLRIDASLFAPAPLRRPGQMGRPRLKGRRLPKFAALLADPKTTWSPITVTEWYGGRQRRLEVVSGTAVWYHSGLPPAPIRWVLVRDPSGEREPQAFLSTDLEATPQQILGWFVSRWRMETTFQEARIHLGVETQRQWSDLAILRTTPALLGLFSLVAIWADQLFTSRSCAVRPLTAAWYDKREPTFSDALAAVRRALWYRPNLCMSRNGKKIIEIPAIILQRLTETLCYAT